MTNPNFYINRGLDYERELGLQSAIAKLEWQDFLNRRKQLMEEIIGSSQGVMQAGGQRPMQSFGSPQGMMQGAQAPPIMEFGQPQGRPAYEEELIAQARFWRIPNPEQIPPGDLQAMIQQRRTETPQDELAHTHGLTSRLMAYGAAAEAGGQVARLVGNLFGGIEELPFAGPVLAQIAGTEKAKRWLYDLSMRTAEFVEGVRAMTPHEDKTAMQVALAIGKVVGFVGPGLLAWQTVGAMGGMVPSALRATSPILRAAVQGGLSGLMLEAGSDESIDSKVFNVGLGVFLGGATALPRFGASIGLGTLGAGIGMQVGDTPEQRVRHGIEGAIAGATIGLLPVFIAAATKVRRDISGPFDKAVNDAVKRAPTGSATIADPPQLPSGPDFEVSPGSMVGGGQQPPKQNLLVRSDEPLGEILRLEGGQQGLPQPQVPRGLLEPPMTPGGEAQNLSSLLDTGIDPFVGALRGFPASGLEPTIAAARYRERGLTVYQGPAFSGPGKLQGTRVIGRDGMPAVVYHGTVVDFEHFDLNKASPEALYGPGFYHTESPQIASGYANDGPSSAGQVKPAKLNIQNPFDLDKPFTAQEAVQLLSQFRDMLPDFDWENSIAGEYMRSNPDHPTLDITGEDLYNLLEFVPTKAPAQGPEQSATGDWLDRPIDGGNLGKVGINNALQTLGYDGFTHIGGARTGNEPHRVWVAFRPDQVHSPWDIPDLSLSDAAKSADAMTKQATIMESASLPDVLAKTAIDDADVIRSLLGRNPKGGSIIRGISDPVNVMSQFGPDSPVRFVKRGDGFDALVGIHDDRAVKHYQQFGVFDGMKVITESGLEGELFVQDYKLLGLPTTFSVRLTNRKIGTNVTPESVLPTTSSVGASPTLDLWPSFKLDLLNNLNKEATAVGMHPVVFHGSPNEIVGDFYTPTFFTQDLNAAEFFRADGGGRPEGGTLSAARITPRNALETGNEAGARLLVQIAEEAGVDTGFTEDKFGWNIDVEELDEMGHLRENLFDLLYIPRVQEALRARGYDAVQGLDPYENYEIPVIIPLDPALVQHLGNAVPLNDPRAIDLMQQHLSTFLDRLGVSDPAKRQAIEEDFNDKWVNELRGIDEGLADMQRELVNNALFLQSERAASGKGLVVSLEEKAEKRGFVWISRQGEGGVLRDAQQPGTPDVPVATDQAAEEFLARVDRTPVDFTPISDVPMEVAEILPDNMTRQPRLALEDETDSISNSLAALIAEDMGIGGVGGQPPFAGGGGFGGNQLPPGRGESLGDQFDKMRRADPVKYYKTIHDVLGLVTLKVRYMRYAAMSLERRLTETGQLDLGTAWKHYDDLDAASVRAFNEGQPWVKEWSDIMHEFPRKILRHGIVTRIHEIEDTNARAAAWWRLQESHGLSERRVKQAIAADGRITDFMHRFAQFMAGDKAYNFDMDREIFRYMPHVRARQAADIENPYSADWLNPEIEFFAEFAREGNTQFRVMDARQLGVHLIRAAMFKKHQEVPWAQLVTAWQDERVPTEMREFMLDYASLVRKGYDPSGELAVRGIQIVAEKVFKTPVTAHEAQHLMNMPVGAMYMSMLAGKGVLFFRDAIQPLRALAKVRAPYMTSVYKDVLVGAGRKMTRAENDNLRTMYENGLEGGWIERENTNLEVAGMFEEQLGSGGVEQLALSPAERANRERAAILGDMIYPLPAWLSRPTESNFSTLKWYGRQGQLHRLIVGEASKRQALDYLGQYRKAEITAVLLQDPTLAMPYEKFEKDSFFGSFEKSIRNELRRLVEQNDDEGAATLFARQVANWSQFKTGRREMPSVLRGNLGRMASVLGNFTGQYIESVASGLGNGHWQHRLRFAMNEGVISATMLGLTALTGWSFYKWAYLPYATMFTGSPMLEKAQRVLAAAGGMAAQAQGYAPSGLEAGAMRDMSRGGLGMVDFFPYTGYVRSLAEYSSAAQGINPFEQAARFTVTGDRGSRMDMERMLENASQQQVPPGSQSPNGGTMQDRGTLGPYGFPLRQLLTTPSPDGGGSQQ